MQSSFPDVIGFPLLASALGIPSQQTHALRAAHGLGLLPVESQMVCGRRVFDGGDVAILAACLSGARGAGVS